MLAWIIEDSDVNDLSSTEPLAYYSGVPSKCFDRGGGSPACGVVNFTNTSND